MAKYIGIVRRACTHGERINPFAAKRLVTMASEIEQQTGVTAGLGLSTRQAGAVGGLAGGIVFGVMMTVMMTEVMAKAIPALWGLEGMVAGWIIHLINSAIFGLIFAAVASRGSLDQYSQRVTRSTGLGILYGIVVWVVAAVIVMPIWLQVVGFPMAPDVPNVNMQSLVGHIAYGLVLGALYPLLRRTQA